MKRNFLVEPQTLFYGFLCFFVHFCIPNGKIQDFCVLTHKQKIQKIENFHFSQNPFYEGLDDQNDLKTCLGHQRDPFHIMYHDFRALCQIFKIFNFCSKRDFLCPNQIAILASKNA